jgi:3-isopropylmalate/(R)-2-methylmalate dehydratase small subunit
MQPFVSVTGPVAPLDRANVDTDQIMPKHALKRVERTGYDEFLFAGWRAEDPDFVLARPEFRHAPILAAGHNFGSGSSREHAPWGLAEWGFRAVVAPSFGDIFRSNSAKNGLLCVILPEADVRELLDSAPAEATVDLERQVVVLPSGRESSFDIDAGIRERLLNGWDDIDLTLQRDAEIAAYERDREREGPNTLAIG